MKHPITLCLVLLASWLVPGPASAQFENSLYYTFGSFLPTGTNVTTAETFVDVGKTGACIPVGMSCTNTSFSLPLSAFASSSAVANIDGRLSAVTDQLANVANRLNGLNAEIARAIEIGAIAAAMKDAVPNSGDRFAIRLNAAAFGSEVGGAVGFAYNATQRARLHLNYGQGRSQSIVSGGVNLSIQ